MKIHADWPRGFLEWREGDTLYLSVAFTWDLPAAANRIIQRTFDQPRRIRVGGPAVDLMPQYLEGLGAEVGGSIPGALQRHNPEATRTTVGCPRRCPFCAVPKTEGAFRELEDWPDLPILVDNNLLKASDPHLGRVFDRLERWGRADFNQGLDPRLLTGGHAVRLKRIGKCYIRLSLDHMAVKPDWERAYQTLRTCGLAKHSIGSYVLVGFRSGVEDAWERCRWVESHGCKAFPMWYHPLDALERNTLTEDQLSQGWNDRERRRIMQWFYHHKQAKV